MIRYCHVIGRHMSEPRMVFNYIGCGVDGTNIPLHIKSFWLVRLKVD